jgi:hypothetical protein
MVELAELPWLTVTALAASVKVPGVVDPGTVTVIAPVDAA